MSYRIVFNRPCFEGKEREYIVEAIANGHVSGDGSFTKKCHNFLESYLGIGKALLTTSCTHALEMAAMLLDCQVGDEVIVPSFTFVSTANAFVLRGVKPVFADIRPDTLNIDESKIESLITPRTKAIAVVHYAGVGAEMDQIMAIAGKYGIEVVEDNAHGLFGKYKSKYLGTFGSISTQSFHETKNISCGEGGALLLNDPQFIDRAEIIREKGTNRSRFFRGQVDKYSWVDIGSSFLPSDLLAAFLYAQFESQESIQSKRQQIWQRYHEGLQEWAFESKVGLPVVPAHCEQPYHMFYLILNSLSERQALIEHLKQRGIMAVYHYLPLHLSTMGLAFGGKLGDCPVTERVSDTILRLPFFNNLATSEQDSVIEAIKQFRVRGEVSVTVNPNLSAQTASSTLP
jgi:dTDP-4-amino-4,6-dideoxygalactose transaminase